MSTVDAGCQDATNEAEDDTECECEKCVDDNDDSEGMDDYGIEYEYYTNHGDNTEDESLSEWKYLWYLFSYQKLIFAQNHKPGTLYLPPIHTIL